MSKCAAITGQGGKCKRIADDSSAYCYAHDPARADERRHYASKGGKVKALRADSTISGELARLQQVFEDISDGVLEGTVDRGAAAVAIQALNGARGCVIGALKAKEQEEMALELTEITATLQERGIAWRG